MSEMKLEIHSHTTASDGEYDPAKLAALMAEHDVDIWALTDHDTVNGCEEAARVAAEVGVDFVTGIEVSADLDGTSIHVLGYGVDPNAAALVRYSEEMQRERKSRMAAMIDKMCNLGFEVTMEDVEKQSGGGNMGRPHLAKALQARGHVDRFQKAFDRWLNRHGPSYVGMSRPLVPDAIQMISDAGGMAVLAHPGRYPDVADHIKHWKEDGLWGVEARHPTHDRQMEERLIRIARKLDMGTTASNDWHGNKPGEMDILGTVRFPKSWRQSFLRALKDTFWGIR